MPPDELPPHSKPTQTPQPTQQISYVARPPKDRSVALILEILPGLIGFLGIGWIYSNKTDVGILLLVGLLVWNFMAIVAAVFTLGFSLCCTYPLNLAFVAVSTIKLNDYTKEHPELFA